MRKATFFQMHPADTDAIADEKCCFASFPYVSFPGRSQMARVMQTKWIFFCLEQRKKVAHFCGETQTFSKQNNLSL